MSNIKTNTTPEPREPLQVTVKPELINQLAQMFDCSVDSIEAEIKDDFEEMIEKYYGLQI